ncbi:hypothetical protein CsSME_00027163 [Camellia sinensis var. sinensis]
MPAGPQSSVAVPQPSSLLPQPSPFFTATSIPLQATSSDPSDLAVSPNPSIPIQSIFIPVHPSNNHLHQSEELESTRHNLEGFWVARSSSKWQGSGENLASISRKRITFSRTTGGVDNAKSCNTSTVDKGHFTVYTADQKRFVIPLVYLNNDIFRVLLKVAEEEYGLPRDGPITLPCDAVFMDDVASLIRRHTAKDLQRELLTTITSGCCLSFSYLQEGLTDQQLLVSSF